MPLVARTPALFPRKQTFKHFAQHRAHTLNLKPRIYHIKLVA